MSKKKILVTGSGGFVFGNFIRRTFFTKQNYHIISIDKVRDSHVIHNVYVNKDHQFYIGNLCDRHFLNVIFEAERPDIVIHGADLEGDDSSVENIDATKSVIDSCKKWGVEKLILSSTDKVYGTLLSENDKPWLEDSPTNPGDSYAVSKLASELLVKVSGLPYVITRSCNNYGPWQGKVKLIPNILKNIISNQKSQIYGQGMQMREWLHVYDHCSALLKIIDNGEINSIYNIGTGHEFTNIEMFQKICNTTESGHDLIEFVNDKPGHSFRRAIDSTKLRELDWAPAKFKENLGQTINWYANNKWFFNLG